MGTPTPMPQASRPSPAAACCVSRASRCVTASVSRSAVEVDCVFDDARGDAMTARHPAAGPAQGTCCLLHVADVLVSRRVVISY
eukprot:scaffold52821_cov63-Phaeocystis_antarctica.AAC.1